MNQVNKNKLGLVVGGASAIMHAVWAAMVFAKVAKPFTGWILGLHFMTFQYSINPFVLTKALMLVVATGIIGYLVGWVSGWLWNLAHRTAHGQ